MTAYEYLVQQYGVPTDGPTMPIEIPGVQRDALATMFAALGFHRGVEIGTLRGEYAKVLCQANPALHLTCVDAWSAYLGFTDQTEQKKLDDCEAIARKRLAPFGCTLVKGLSTDVARRFPDQSVDFVYIDANHRFEYVVADIAAWLPKIRPGGVISGHDYCTRRLRKGVDMRVLDAVHGWTSSYDVTPWYVLGRGKIRKGELADRMRSWLWMV